MRLTHVLDNFPPLNPKVFFSSPPTNTFVKHWQTMPGVIDFLEDGEGSSSAVDITSSLLGGGKWVGKGQKSGNRGSAAQEDDDDGDAQFISAAINKQNKKTGTEVLKQTSLGKGKGRNKAVSGTISGGGSFQSMGEW